MIKQKSLKINIATWSKLYASFCGCGTNNKRQGSKTRNKAVRQHALASWRKKQKRESERAQTAHAF